MILYDPRTALANKNSSMGVSWLRVASASCAPDQKVLMHSFFIFFEVFEAQKKASTQ